MNNFSRSFIMASAGILMAGVAHAAPELTDDEQKTVDTLNQLHQCVATNAAPITEDDIVAQLSEGITREDAEFLAQITSELNAHILCVRDLRINMNDIAASVRAIEKKYGTEGAAALVPR